MFARKYCLEMLTAQFVTQGQPVAARGVPTLGPSQGGEGNRVKVQAPFGQAIFVSVRAVNLFR